MTHFVANSQTVADRIRRYYHRESTVIYPPVDTAYFMPAPPYEKREDFFFAVSQLVPYKRVDLAIEAFNRNGRHLVVIGEGSEQRRLGRRARPNIRFLGSQPRAALRQAMRRARALVFPGEEDLGIVRAEAQACGTPVIAFRSGGASEIVTDGATGILFAQQTAASLEEGLERFDAERFDPAAIRESALRFTREKFMREFTGFLERVVSPGRVVQSQSVESGQEVLAADSAL